MPTRSLGFVVVLFAWLLNAAVANEFLQQLSGSAPASTATTPAVPAVVPSSPVVTTTPPAAAPVGTPVQPTAQATTTAQPAVVTTPTQPATTATPAAAPTIVPPPPAPALGQPAPDAMQAAVALNYCRTSFHRIRRFPIRFVLAEEQEKILNNINLDGIADHEVIVLYTSVLDEINQIPMAHYERKVANQYYDSLQQRKIIGDILAIGADVATAHYGAAVQTGVTSWWDYRVMDYQQQADVLKIDKSRLASVVQKSALFLDTFWQMAQKKRIPDRWLVRGDDLDALDQAMHEPNPEVRLRILKRMEPFMEAYPPYWYYVARTQQELGQLFAALNTYTRVVALGTSHFRKDDMLATALANKAGIQDYLRQPSAAETAEKALTYSTDVWETNLICAQVLRHNHKYTAAEDAVLRNLDVQLETDKSRAFLVSLYDVADRRDKLLRQLSDPQIVATIPAPILLRCSARLGKDATPPHVLRTIVNSLEAHPRFQFGQDELVLRAAPTWLLNLATIHVYHDGVELAGPEMTAGNGAQQLRYTADSDWGSPLDPTFKNLSFEMRLVYPDRTAVELSLSSSSELAGGAGGFSNPARSVTARMSGAPTLRISRITVADETAAADAPTVTASISPTSPEPAASSLPAVDIPLPPRSEE